MTFESLQSYFSVLNYHNSNESSASTHICMDIALYSKEQYDARYNNLIASGILAKGYEQGAVFRIGGQEYMVGSDGKLDVPYGTDIWNMEYPGN